ncbi:uncharacterized protein An03g01000 [Aspergillus niger]|uniref:Contig An03c0040, genomic contig n=2 Tax=Aspergillus niger TaxID=5061 RepID=A2QFW3_ASPNC|nr:uncharacterized protein An03g01000 [Aspergillus niger]CAK38073.1 unnamed protein product [Aspergillus niger]
MSPGVLFAPRISKLHHHRRIMFTRHMYELECDQPIKKGPPLVDPSTLAPAILATIFFFIRIAAKLANLAGGWGLDDLTVTIAWILGVALFVVNTYMIKYGFGMNTWDILPFHHVTLVFQYFEGLAMMYKIQISLCKISVLLFLLRIFQSRVFRVCAYILIAINAAIGITFSLVDLLRCVPVHLDWHSWTGEYEGVGTCINFIAAVLVHCLVNIFVDVVIVLLPIYEVSKLQLPWMKKINVALMFMMGLILTIIAIIRVIVFWENRWTTNLTGTTSPTLTTFSKSTPLTHKCIYSRSPAPHSLVRHRIPDRNHDDLSPRRPRVHKPIRPRSSRQHTTTDLRPNQLSVQQRRCILRGHQQQDFQVSEYLR